MKLNLTEAQYETLRQYLSDLSTDDILSIVRQINGYNSDLNNLVWYDIDNEFNELLDGLTPWEIARSIFYGDFNPCHSYWRYDAYGNLESTNFIDYDDDDITSIIDTIEWIEAKYIPDEIIEFLEEEGIIND